MIILQGTCSASPSLHRFQVASFPWNFSITVTVGITFEELKSRLCELSRVSFPQLTNDRMIFFDTNCELVNTIVWFQQYVELFSHLWSPYFLVNMITFKYASNSRLVFKITGISSWKQMVSTVALLLPFSLWSQLRFGTWAMNYILHYILCIKFTASDVYFLYLLFSFILLSECIQYVPLKTLLRVVIRQNGNFSEKSFNPNFL